MICSSVCRFFICLSPRKNYHRNSRLTGYTFRTQVKGIGRWSAEMFLMFRLGRLDVLPVDDLGLRKGAQRVYGLRELPDRRRLHRLAARWIPFRSIATWYLWRSLESGGI